MKEKRQVFTIIKVKGVEEFDSFSINNDMFTTTSTNSFVFQFITMKYIFAFLIMNMNKVLTLNV